MPVTAAVGGMLYTILIFNVMQSLQLMFAMFA